MYRKRIWGSKDISIEIDYKISQCAISNTGFLKIRVGLVWSGRVLINFLDSESFVVSFHKKLKIGEKKSLGFAKQIIRNLVASCIIIHTDNFFDEILKLANSISYASQPRGSLWVSAVEIFP